MSKKHWTEMSRENKHEIQKMRFAFLKEHARADQIVVSHEGVPLQAIYFTPEMPGYGETCTDVPFALPPTKEVK